MKKFILSLGLIAMAFNLTNCAQNEEATPSVETKGDFALYATVTKTANDGVNTIWSAKDEINVFHAVGETTTYVNDTPYTNGAGTPFVCNDATTGYFLGAITGTLDPEEEYDWYAFYPYSSYINTPANNGSGYRNVGSPAGIAQVQIGNDSMAHIAGENYPMAGYAVAVPANQQPHLTFTHISSLVEFEVTNKLAEAITVTEIQLTAGVDIVGSYYINFADSKAYQFTSSGANYVSNTALLTVTNGTEIAANASAKFYAAIKPFTANAGSNLEVVVSATSATGEGTHVKTITLTDAVEFKSGKIKPVKVNYTTAIEAPAANEVYETIDFSKQGYANQTAISSFDGNFCSIAFDKGSNNNDPKYYTTGSAIRCYGGNTFTISSDLNIVKVVFTFATGENANEITATPGTFATDTWEGDATSVTFTIGGTTGHRRIQKMVITYNGELQPTIVPTAPAAVAYNATSATINYKLVAASGTVTAVADADWITAVDTTEAGKVKLSLTENTAYTNRSANVTLSIDGADDVVVPVTQNAKPKPTLTLTSSTINVDASETTATINYTYSNLVDNVTATTDADWITAIDTTEAGKVKLTLTANTGDAREAKVTLLSTDATPQTATITQASAGSVSLGGTWSYTFTTTTYTANGSKTLNGLSWTLAGDGGYWGYDATKGQQFGKATSGYQYKTLTLSTTSYKGGVKSIKINTSGASSISGSFTVSVGGKQIGSKTTLTKTATEYTFTSDEVLEGEIKFSYTQTSVKAIYIKSITIN